MHRASGMNGLSEWCSIIEHHSGMALNFNAIPSKDSKVRKVDVRVVRQGTQRVYSRPVSEVVLLVKGE